MGKTESVSRTAELPKSCSFPLHPLRNIFLKVTRVTFSENCVRLSQQYRVLRNYIKGKGKKKLNLKFDYKGNHEHMLKI